MVLLMIFFFFYPRIMVTQIMWKLERVVANMEEMSEKGKVFLLREISKNPDKETKDMLNNFFEFFFIPPVTLDPMGSVKRLDHLLKAQKNRFNYFVNRIVPKYTDDEKANITMGLAAGISLYDITKIVRHFVELAKKTKSIQIAMIVQMQLPLIESMAKSLYKGTIALSKGQPIGDAAGPYVAATLIGDKKTIEIEEDIIMGRTTINGRTVFILKARGPGGRIGSPGKAVEKIIKKTKIAKVITIDAAAKLEGEKTGGVAEGVGVAMGGPGVERSYIENIVTQRDIPLDSVIIKMSQEEAITPMRKAIKDAVPKAIEAVYRSIDMEKKGSNIIIVGVGNTSGVGNTKKDLEKVADWIEKNEKRILAQKKKKDN
ncbi:MAG: DUF1512 family protein [Candidatus Aenigmatarchaeota archaeon]